MAADGFFSRWSRQKTQARAQQPAPERDKPTPAPLPSAAPHAAASALVEVPPASASNVGADPLSSQVPEAQAPTLADVAQLTPASDFTPFVARGVSQAVKNAALKKLFADPHFNVMDGLDIYIDDYSIPSPLSPDELKQLVSAQFVKLVQAPDAVPPTDIPQASPDRASISNLDGSEAHDHPDLQLQPDDAAQRPGAEPGA